jgi:magnesium transporter
MLSATITGSIINEFSELLSVMPMLVAFIPMLMNSGGNAGSQSSVLIIRGMALGEIHTNEVLKVLYREIQVGALCGFGLGIVNFLRVYMMEGKDVLLSLSVSLSLVMTLVMAKSIGCMLPIITKKMGMDPAIIAAPMLTTIVDAASLIVYFSIVRVVFNI